MKPIVSEKDFPTANKFVYLNAANVFVSSRASAMRFSPHFYNTVKDIDSALAEIDNIIMNI